MGSLFHAVLRSDRNDFGLSDMDAFVLCNIVGEFGGSKEFVAESKDELVMRCRLASYLTQAVSKHVFECVQRVSGFVPAQSLFQFAFLIGSLIQLQVVY